MKNKGFTLIEILGVIVILGLLVGIVYQVFNKELKNSKEKAYNIQINTIVKIAKDFHLKNINSERVSIEELNNLGLLNNEELIDPRDKSLINGCIYFMYNETYKQTEYEFVRSESCYDSYEFAYTGNYQEFIVPMNGYYQIELWGAQGGDYATIIGGRGGYSKGLIYLTKGTNIYIYVGGNPSTSESGGYNGGGPLISGQSAYGRAGGGATDIRLVSGVWNDTTGLRSRIIVAGGGGGANYRNYNDTSCGYGQGEGGDGGKLIGETGITTGHTYNGCTYGWSLGTGGLQKAGGQCIGYGPTGVETYRIETSYFGYASAESSQSGGGGGYYAGGNSSHGGAGGGSSFISGYAGVNAITNATTITHSNNTLHYSGKYFINGKMESGVNEGNGKAKINYLGTIASQKRNNKLDNIRYIKSCLNGNSKNPDNHWVELQAIVNGTNLAKGKTVTGTVTQHVNFSPYTVITDGDITSSYYGMSSVAGLQCITIDLGKTYNLDELALWLYWADGRIYYQNTLSVGSTNVPGTAPLSTILHTHSGTNGYIETSEGRRYSAYD